MRDRRSVVSGSVRRWVALTAALVALVPVIPTVNAVSPNAVVTYRVTLDVSGEPHIPYPVIGLRACTTDLLACVAVYADYDDRGEHFPVPITVGDTRVLVPFVQAGPFLVEGAPTTVTATAGADTDLGPLPMVYDGPIVTLDAAIRLLGAPRGIQTQPLLTFCRTRVRLERFCVGGGTITLQRRQRSEIRLLPGSWRMVAGYESDRPLEGGGSTTITIGDEPTVLGLDSGDSRRIDETVRVRPTGELLADISVRAPADYFASRPEVIVVVELCAGRYSCGTVARVPFTSAGSMTLGIPVASGRWRLRTRLTDVCYLVSDEGPSGRFTMEPDAVVERRLQFDVADMRGDGPTPRC